MKPIRYHEMRPHQIREVRDDFPVAYLPMGVLEWHGEHNPVGLDAVKATAMAEHFARDIGGLVMPTLWYGDNRQILAEVVFGGGGGPDAFDHRPGIMAGYGGLNLRAFQDDAERSKADGGWDTWATLYRHALNQISTLGFSVIVTLSGHYPLSEPAEWVSEDYNETEQARVISIIGCDLVEDLFHDERGKGGDHAARWETSLLMYLRPELVELERLDPDPNTVLVGVLGEDPRKLASAEYGKKAMMAITERLDQKVREALRSVAE